MFDRKYAARDRFHGKASRRHCYYCGRRCFDPDNTERDIKRAIAVKMAKTAPSAEIEPDIPEPDRYWDDVSEYNLSTLTPNQWREYTTPQPFCMVPDAPPERTLPRRPKMERRDPTYRGFWSALKETAKDLEKQGRKEEAQAHRAKWLNDGPEPPMPTAEQIISKAGGRVVKIA